ncbi:type VI secretion system tube protein TssD [Aquimarina sp. MMG016]|uniref:type VI secretion system tube protein TssD n=1 Tax=Aquimarina sp. MMG016 TaxID=2822690 RepID=UPI001B3A01D2|nr:type VI secretion system tube protein TssD [Aquimarina sp. MMG016]MBQ4821280.1 phage tail protein [Aquimarina sp. MMG016]
MSFKAKLKVGGSEFNVLSSSYGLHQETDATGRPSSITRGGKLTVTVESTSETILSDLAFNNFQMTDGEVIFMKRDTEATSKSLSFKNAYLVKYVENFDSTGKNPMTETVTFSAREIGIGTASHVNEWV